MIAMPKKLSPEVIAACVGGGITCAQIEHIYSLVCAAVSLYQAQPAPAVDREARELLKEARLGLWKHCYGATHDTIERIDALLGGQQ